MKFTKMQGAGNDFIIINNIEENLPRDSFSDLARTLCPRRTAVGADGLMAVEKAEEGGDFRMLFFNADGSQGEMCGNGARCIAKFGYDAGIAGKVMEIETAAGLVKAWRQDGDQYKIRLNNVTVMDLNRVLELDSADIWDGKNEWPCAYVELGSPGLPHLTVEYPGLAEEEPERLYCLGKALRSHKDLPKGANVNFYEIQKDGSIFERTFERGVEDFTLACGTGTGSVAAVLTEKGLVSGDRPVTIRMAGGTLQVEVCRSENGEISDLYLSGPAKAVYQGETV